MKKKRILSTALAAVMMLSTIIAAAALQTVYAAEESTKVLDMNFNDSDLTDAAGTVTATAELGTPNYVEGHDGGKAIELNGSILNLGNSAELQPDDITVSFWAKAPAGGYGASGLAERTFFWFKDVNGYNTDGWYLTSAEEMPLYFVVGTGVYGGGVQQTTMSLDEFFPEEEWVHVAITYDGTSHELSCYRNGTQIETTMIYGTACDIVGSSCNKYVGRQGYSNANGLTGALDDIQIYSDVLSSAEIALLSGQEPENVALTATPAVSFFSNWQKGETVLNDGKLTYDTDGEKWGTWGNTNAAETAAYTWEKPVLLTGTDLYIWDNEPDLEYDGIATPKSLVFEYLPEGSNEWTVLKTVEENIIGSKEGALNSVVFDTPVTATALRVTLNKNMAEGTTETNAGVGATEWVVYGFESQGIVSKSDLQAAVDAEKEAALEESIYTEESWKTYADALAAAEALLTNDAATSEELGAALEALTDAKETLEVAPPETMEEALVFEMNFENLEAASGEALTDTFTANTGETVTVYDNVSIVEGHDGGKAIDLGFNKGYLTIPNTDELNSNYLSVSVWLKRYESANSEARIMWAKPNNSWNGNGWFLGWTTGESMAMVIDGQNMAVEKGNADTRLPENEWTNITATFDGSTGAIIVYQDGIKFAEATITGGSITKSSLTDILIGKSGYGNVGIGCYADDFQIYNKALTSAEVGKLVGLTEEDFVQADADALSVPYRVSSNFKLALTGGNGSVITWEADHAAITLDEDGNAVVTRGSDDVTGTLTATVALGENKVTRTFEVTVAKENQPVEGMQKLSYDEIISVGGSVGARLNDAVDHYAMDYLYGQKLPGYLNEYKNHSHSHWSWLEGEQPGKWLESMANYKWMNDPEIDAAIKDVVAQLAATQTVEDRSKSGYNQFAGYLGNGTEAIRNSQPVKGMDPYEMYSTLNGLIGVYEKYKEDDPELAAQAIDCAIKLADYLVATIGDENTKVCYQDGTESTVYKKEFWPLAITNGVTIAGHDVHQGWEGALIIDPMMLLSETVKEIEGQENKSTVYSEWVDWVIGNIDKWASTWGGYGDTPYADLDKVATGEMGIHEIQHYVHAHTFQMTFLGFLKKYQETGDETYLNKVVGAWEDIISRQVYITGTTSVGEHYEAGHNLPNTGSVGETCATNSWTLMNNNLFELTADARYQQVVEDVIFNHMFATSTIDGDGYSYHRPLNGSTERFYTGPDCCSSSGMRMQSYVPYYIYTKAESDVYVNQFIESEAKIALADGKIMHLKQTGDYPITDDITIEVLEDTTADTLYVRVPEWVEDAVIKVNDTEVKGIAANEYMKVTVEAGDTVVITYPSEPEWVEGDFSNEGSWTIKEGPMVYCVDAAFMTVEESQESFGADVAPVSATAVIDAEDGKAVETVREIELEGDRYFGNGYMIKMMTPNGEQNVAIVPYANIGQWYRYGEEAPGLYGANYASAVRYSYMIWMPSGISTYPQTPEEVSGPVVHYDFDSIDGTTIKDISGNGKDATAVGSVTYEEGKLENGISLNGTNAYVQLPEDVLYGLYNMSISAWINPEEVVNWARVFDFGNGQVSPPYPNLFLTVQTNSGTTRLAYEDGTNSHVDTAAFATNTWTHITVTIAGSKAALYVNGTKVSENTSFHMLPFQIADMTSNFIGKSNYTADSLFKGDIDDFRIYNRALGTDEITMLANGEEPVRTIQTVEQPAAVETTVGTAPVLPEKANVTYTNGTQGREVIVWEEVAADNYAQAGTFEVKGTVGEQDVTITVTVKETGEKPEPLPYEDVAETDWFYDAVAYTYYEGLMTGMDATHFGPYGQLSRAQFALILFRMEGEKAVETEKTFADISGDEWYGPAVLWAAENGIVTGYQNGNFGPADMITREQMAVMMYRYAKYLKQDVTTEGDYSSFEDAASVSEFAGEAMTWAVGKGIITGKENGTKIDPQGNTARSEAAIIIQRFRQ